LVTGINLHLVLFEAILYGADKELDTDIIAATK